MTDEEILELWRSGYSKTTVAKMYKQSYNRQIDIIRLDVRNRHEGKKISSYEALARVEKLILSRRDKWQEKI